MHLEKYPDHSEPLIAETGPFFDAIFKNALANAMLMLDKAGNILRANEAFKHHFGYAQNDLAGKHFRILFIEADRATARPERELENTLANGASTDNNFILRKDGEAVWVSGESIRVGSNHDGCCIVKIIQNIHAQKLLETFLTEANDLLNVVMHSVTHAALVVLDSGLRIVRVNEKFCALFEMGDRTGLEGSKLSATGHSLWRDAGLQQLLRSALVTGKPIRAHRLNYQQEDGTVRALCLDSRIVEAPAAGDRHMLLVLEDEKHDAVSL